jgi:glycosyltransferase involved in cell wall biosynthesis
MATGLPVIATNVGGNSELVEDGIGGELIPPGDYEAMSEKILGYINNTEIMHYHAKQAFHRVQTEFSLTNMVNRYQRVYDSLLKQE